MQSKKMTRKLFSVVLFMALTLSQVFPVGVPGVASAEDEPEIIPEVKYINENGAELTAENVKVVTENDKNLNTINGEWYAVTKEIKISDRIYVDGNVHLILCDGGSLTVSSGIEVSKEGNSFTVYGQQNNTGELTAESGAEAGIGGGLEGNGSNITISGGTVTAKSDQGAAIGGGDGGSGSNITINGGTVTATGRDGAGIGGGREGSGSNITINGGNITATGRFGAGIGGGRKGSGSSITINGGNISATGEDGAGIGGGNGGSGSNISIHDGIVVSSTRWYGAGIGGSGTGDGTDIVIDGGDVTALGGLFLEIHGIGGGVTEEGEAGKSEGLFISRDATVRVSYNDRKDFDLGGLYTTGTVYFYETNDLAAIQNETVDPKETVHGEASPGPENPPSVDILPTETAAPKLTATSKNKKVTLKWKKISGATKYKVYQKKKGKFKAIKTLKKTKCVIKKGLKVGKKYTFAVKAYSNGVWSKITKKSTATVKVKK